MDGQSPQITGPFNYQRGFRSRDRLRLRPTRSRLRKVRVGLSRGARGLGALERGWCGAVSPEERFLKPQNLGPAVSAGRSRAEMGFRPLSSCTHDCDVP